jgi:NAD(P)-dependent dehydrogenase (short-subunit alcohol dehydrogenase family)
LTLNPTWEFYGYDAAAYKVSKATMNMVGAKLAVKYATKGFKVNICNPGYCTTGLNNFAAAAGDPSQGTINACHWRCWAKMGK